MAYRLAKRAATAAAAGGEPSGAEPGESDLPPPLRLPRELTAFPWDLVRARWGFAGADLLSVLALVLWRVVGEVKAQTGPVAM